MARLHTCGFELNDTSTGSWDDKPSGVNGTASVQTSIVRSGTYAGKLDSTGSNGTAKFTPGTNQSNLSVSATNYLRFYFQFTNLPTGTVKIISDSFGWAVKLTSGGLLQLWDLTHNTQVGSSSSALSTGIWYRIEIKITLDGSQNVTALELRLDGVSVASGAPVIASGTTVVYGWLDAPGASKVFYVDDVAFNDSSGSSQTSWPGAGNVVLLKPVSDNARGTNWKAGGGGTTNLWDAVNNLPPVGLADASSTNTSQVKNVVSDTTGNYDANLTDYLTAGVPAGSSISLVQPIWNFSAAESTSLTIAMLLVSNPQGNGGTESTATANGATDTYPTLWAWNNPRAQNVYAPSPTLGTSPVIRVGKRTASATGLECDFMGAYVEFSSSRIPRAPGCNFQDPGVM